VVGVRNFDEEIDGIGVDKRFGLEVHNHSVANACLLSSLSSLHLLVVAAGAIVAGCRVLL
jgi:hypothetical protein